MEWHSGHPRPVITATLYRISTFGGWMDGLLHYIFYISLSQHFRLPESDLPPHTYLLIHFIKRDTVYVHNTNLKWPITAHAQKFVNLEKASYRNVIEKFF